MKSIWMRRAGIACLFLLLVALVLLIAPVARVSASPSTLSACINPGNGMMRLVSDSSQCHANENFVTWNITGPAGPAGPAGPSGPAGPPGSSAGGPPFVWVCTPASFPKTASTTDANIYIFNGSSSTANTALHIYDKDGNNLAGVLIPGTVSDHYPGETGTTTVALNSKATRIVHFFTPLTSGGDTDASFAVEVVSDQPIEVGSNFEFSGFHPVPCGLLPK